MTGGVKRLAVLSPISLLSRWAAVVLWSSALSHIQRSNPHKHKPKWQVFTYRQDDRTNAADSLLTIPIVIKQKRFFAIWVGRVCLRSVKRESVLTDCHFQGWLSLLAHKQRPQRSPWVTRRSRRGRMPHGRRTGRRSVVAKTRGSGVKAGRLLSCRASSRESLAGHRHTGEDTHVDTRYRHRCIVVL